MGKNAKSLAKRKYKRYFYWRLLKIIIFRLYRSYKSKRIITIKSDIVNDKICHLITQGLINVKHVIWILVLKKNLRNIEKKNIAVTLLVIVKINCKVADKEEGILPLPLQSILFIY